MTIIPFLALLGVFFLQSAALRLVALICKSENVLGEIDLNRKLYLSISGMIILPVTVLTLLYEGTDFGIIAILISKILFGILILLMMIRLLRVFAEAKVSYFFRFLYLCTFEISPYLALFIVFENIN
jgi:Mg2+ and Co2+ transporter CorA